MLPKNVPGCNAKEHQTQWMNTLKLNNDEWIGKNFYFLVGGYNTLKTT